MFLRLFELELKELDEKPEPEPARPEARKLGQKLEAILKILSE